MAQGPAISACLIVKNESRQIESCLKSIRPYVQEICVVDTGSDDGTPDIVRKYADRFEVFTDCNDLEGRIASFAKARQRSFELATKPWVMWIDGDDEVRGAEHLSDLVVRHEAERGGDPALIMLPYEYSHDHVGNVTCLHYRERLATPKEAFQWRGPVHEVLNPERPGTHMFQSDLVRIVHRRASSGKPSEPGRNLRILKAHYEEVGESDVRQLYYLGLEYGNAGDVGNALKFHKRYVELSGWDDEKFLACLKIAEHYQALGQYDDAVQWALKCLTVREGWAEAYFSLSKSFYFMAQRGGPDEKRNWERSVHYARLGLAMPPTKTILFINPLERTYDIHRYLNFALNKIGDVAGAVESAKVALEVRPDDEGIRGNLRLYEDFLAKKSVRDSMDRLVDLGSVGPEARSLVDDIIEGRFQVLSDSPPPLSADPSAGPPAPSGKESVLSAIELLWKELLVHDEVVSARNLLLSAPWTVRGSPEVRRMLSVTEPMLEHVSCPDAYRDFYSRYGVPGDKVEAIPLPNPVLQEYSQWPRWRFALDSVSSLPGPMTVLDVGCFDGWMTNRLGMDGHRTYGVDASRDYVDLANRKAAEFGTGATHAVATVPYDPLPAGFPDRYDLVICYELYEHVPDTRELTDFLFGCVKPGGHVLLSTPRGSWMQGARTEIQEGWNEPVCREHVRAPINADVESDLRASGFEVVHSGDSLSTWESKVPGQGTILVRGRRPASSEISPDPLDLVLYVGWGAEPWNPDTVRLHGIGGSETAAMEVSKRLARLGHRVRLFGDCQGMEGTFDGVEYLHHDRFKDVRCDVLITSRRPHAVDDGFGVRARATLCWVHDVACGDALTHARALRIDRFLTLSQWHRGFFLDAHRCVHPSQVVVTRNGIDLSRFRTPGIVRNPHKAVYSSSPDRGLDVALRCWSRVRERVPDAELHVFYGFKTWEASVRSSGDEGQRKLLEYLRESLRKAADHGVVYRDRVGQSELAREFQSAGVWAYPTWFSETSCITAMEAQAAGLRIVTSPIAALNETVGPRGAMIPGDWLSQEYQDRWVDAVVDAMLRPESGDREGLIEYAFSNFGYDDLVRDWDLMLRQVLSDVERDVLPPYRSAAA